MFRIITQKALMAAVFSAFCAGMAFADEEAAVPAGAVGYEGLLLGHVKSVDDAGMVLAVRAIKAGGDSKAKNARQLLARNVRLVFKRFTTDDGESHPEPMLRPRAELALQTQGVAMVAVSSQEKILVVSRISVSGGKIRERNRDGDAEKTGDRERDRERIGDRERPREGGDREGIHHPEEDFNRKDQEGGDRERVGGDEPSNREGGDGADADGFREGDGEFHGDEGGFDRGEGDGTGEAPAADEIEIGISTTGYFLNGRRVSMEELESNLRRIAAENPEIAVSVQPDGDVAYSAVQDVLATCARNKLLRVSFAASSRKREGEPNGEKNHDLNGQVADLRNEVHQLRTEIDELKMLLRKAIEEK